MKKKYLSIVLITILTVVSVYFYSNIFTANTNFDKKEEYVFVPTNSSFEDLLKIIKPFVKSEEKFKKAAKLRSYDENIFPGRFLLKKGMSSFQIITALRNNQPINLSFNNQETLEKLVSRISSQIEVDSITLFNSLKEEHFLKEKGFNQETLLGMYIPNTYQIKWNISAEKFRERMYEEYNNFWNEKRTNQAKTLGLTKNQVMALASIVHKETVKTSERPRVAGVYLNRLKLDMPLQADPTVIFAVKKKNNNFDAVIKRVTADMLAVNSPYNTYLQLGIPPGPINMPDITAIDAVLNPEKHDYIYFCASIERFGYHEFESSYEKHLVWAKKYRDWLDSQSK